MKIKREKPRPVFLATICAQRATNGWQRAQASAGQPPQNEPEVLRSIREYAGPPVPTDEECEALRKVYAAFPPCLMVSPDRTTAGEYEIRGWLPQADAEMAEACWLMETILNGWPEDKKAEFTRQWQTKQYTLLAPLTIPGALLEFHAQITPHGQTVDDTSPTWPPQRVAYDRLRTVALANIQAAPGMADITGDCDTCPRAPTCKNVLYMCDYDGPMARRYCKQTDCRKKGGNCCKTHYKTMARPAARCMCPVLQVAGQYIARQILDEARKEEGAQNDMQKSN